jgi:hypothetical protein
MRGLTMASEAMATKLGYGHDTAEEVMNQSTCLVARPVPIASIICSESVSHATGDRMRHTNLSIVLCVWANIADLKPHQLGYCKGMRLSYTCRVPSS